MILSNRHKLSDMGRIICSEVISQLKAFKTAAMKKEALTADDVIAGAGLVHILLLQLAVPLNKVSEMSTTIKTIRIQRVLDYDKCLELLEQPVVRPRGTQRKQWTGTRGEKPSEGKRSFPAKAKNDLDGRHRPKKQK